MTDAPPSAHPSQPAARPRGRSTADNIRLVVAALVGGLIVAFIVLNTQQVSVNWIVTTTSTPLIVVILVSLAVGGVGAVILLRFRQRAARRRRRASAAGH